MSDAHPWPDCEHVEGIDWLATPFPEMVVRLEEKRKTAEARANRHDTASAAIERFLAFELARGQRLVSTGMMLEMVAAAACYGQSAHRARGIDDLLRDFEKELSGNSGLESEEL